MLPGKRKQRRSNTSYLGVVREDMQEGLQEVGAREDGVFDWRSRCGSP